MSIVIKPVSGGSGFTFPALPEKVKMKKAAKYQSIDILSKGTVKIQRGTDVSEVSWDGEFFGVKKKTEPIVQKNAWQDPQKCKKIIEDYVDNETVLNLIITEIGLNMDVTISSFQPTAYGAFGNLQYSITFTQKKNLEIYTTDELKITAFVKKTVARSDTSSSSSTSSSGTTYTVVSGDTLSAIAKKKMGAASKWTSIYDANSSTIEAAAKKHGKSSSDHGHWIYTGTKLTIPAA